MISKNKVKWIRALELKKNRQREGLFVAEGPKVVGDLLAAGIHARLIVVAEQATFTDTLTQQLSSATIDETVTATASEFAKASFLQHPQDILGVFEMKRRDGTDEYAADSLALALDGVQDPGNMGTIIRIADWFGIDTIYCSPGTADVYNPKVVQATMGSIARVNIVYTDLAVLIDRMHAGTPVYGTLLDGDDIYQQPLTANGLIVMGNEGNGISPEIRRKVTRKLLIPNFNKNDKNADSLNVAISTAIVCSEFRRRGISNNPLPIIR